MPMLLTLSSITFVYVPREDRIAVAINAGRADAWSCWLTRRLALAVLQRATEYLVSTSDLAQRAPAEFRSEAAAFERDAAIAKTAPAMSNTPPAVLKASTDTAELAERLTISREGDAFRLELRGQDEHGAAGSVNRAELQRVLQMLHTTVMQANWLTAPATGQASPPIPADTKPARH
jgi:hypothetical protein